MSYDQTPWADEVLASESPLKEISARSKLFCVDLGRLVSKNLFLSLDCSSFLQCLFS